MFIRRPPSALTAAALTAAAPASAALAALTALSSMGYGRSTALAQSTSTRGESEYSTVGATSATAATHGAARVQLGIGRDRFEFLQRHMQQGQQPERVRGDRRAGRRTGLWRRKWCVESIN